MEIREDLLAILELSNQSPSYSYWNEILNYFRTNKTKLTIHEVKILAFESERCRERINARSEEHIHKSDVNPNIPAHLARLEYEEYKSEEHIGSGFNVATA